MNPEELALRAERAYLEAEWTSLLTSIYQMKTCEPWEKANAHARAIVAAALREFREGKPNG